MLIAGDFNKHTTEGGLLHSILNESQLIDIFPFFGIQVPTSNQGPHMLDRMLLSSNLVSHITDHKIKSLDYLVSTDHCPLTVSLSFNAPTTNEYNNCQLTSNHTTKVMQYIEEVHRQLQRKKILERIGELTETNCNEVSLDYIDQLFLKIHLQAENKMKRQYKDWWHTDLKVWKQELKKLNNTLFWQKGRVLSQNFGNIHNIAFKFDTTFCNKK
jgi:hypothetical protein